jgi:S-DNA-T family DNA segregation ATPase FtsK/SpoIIIE
VNLGRRARRARITTAFDAFHAAMGAVLGAAARLTDAAAREHALAMVEMWLRREGLDAASADPGMQGVLANPHVATAVSRVTADRDAAFEEWVAQHGRDDSGPARLAALMSEFAPGVAGAVDGWLPQEPEECSTLEGAGRVPQLWRIGTGVVGAGAATADRAFPVGVPLLDESHLQIDPRTRTVPTEAERQERRAVAESLVEALLLRAVGYFRPGLVHVHVWDVGRLTGSLPGLYPLTRTGLLTVHDPGGLEVLLEQLADRIRLVNTRVLVGGYPSLKALARVTGQRAEPWVVVVLVGDGAPLKEADQVQRVLRDGLAAGISVVLLDIPMTIGAPLETIGLQTANTLTGPVTVATTSMTGPHVTVTVDPPLPRHAVVTACRAVADAHERWRSRVATFRELLPPEWGEEKSRTELCAPVGFDEGVPRAVKLADSSPHALIGGPSGSGKTNLLLTLICSLATRYDPNELEFYLLDFKEGVSFAQFARERDDHTWLPHARLVGVNINTDREFGLALLQHLAEEMRHRADVAKQNEVTKLEELRAAGVPGRWPRIVAIIDEFQFLFGEKDAVTNQAVQLLEDLARRGRSQGIHLVLASQDVSGIQAFWMRPAIFEQFVLRIGLPRARRILVETNDATMHLSRWHAVVNHESGVRHGNEVLRIPEAGKETVDGVLAELYRRYVAERPEEERPAKPRLFDGSKAPLVTTLTKGLAASTGTPQALVGQRIDVAGSAATVALPDVPGRNIGVLGTGGRDAMRVLAAAALSLGEQHRNGPKAQFVLAPLIAEAAASATALEGQLFPHSCKVVPLDGFAEWVTDVAGNIVKRLSSLERLPTYLLLYGGDAVDAILTRPQQDDLRKVLRFGPEVGIHTVGWWRSPARLKSLLTTSASADDLGAFVALDVQGAELSPLAPPGLLPVWSPRPGRALLFDRARHTRPEVVIVPSPDEVAGPKQAGTGDPADAHVHTRPA